MEVGKSVWASKTFWGAMLVLISLGFQQFGINIGDSTEWVNNIMSLVGAVLAIYGRITAIQKIE